MKNFKKNKLNKMGSCFEKQEEIGKNELIIMKNGLRNKKITRELNNNLYNKNYNVTNYILPKILSKRDNIRNYYKIYNNILGEGGVSKVYLGENNYGKFAIKCIPKNSVMSPKDILNEAYISMKLNHRNIVKFYEIYEDKYYVYFVMELCEDGDLVTLLANSPNNCLNENLVINIMIQIFEVVDFLHNEMNLIHRDLKPENFLIKYDQNKNIIIKLCDFGLSIHKPQYGQKLIEIVGTEKIQAPEIIRRIGYDEKVDEWSIGIVMYNLLTSQETFLVNKQLLNNILYGKINFELISDLNLRKLTSLLLNRDVSTRIDVKQALNIIKKIKYNKIIANQKLNPKIMYFKPYIKNEHNKNKYSTNVFNPNLNNSFSRQIKFSSSTKSIKTINKIKIIPYDKISNNSISITPLNTTFQLPEFQTCQNYFNDQISFRSLDNPPVNTQRNNVMSNKNEIYFNFDSNSDIQQRSTIQFIKSPHINKITFDSMQNNNNRLYTINSVSNLYN